MVRAHARRASQQGGIPGRLIVTSGRWHDALGALESGAPWFDPWQEDGARVAASLRQGLTLRDALNRGGAAPVRFVPGDELPEGAAYELHVFDTRLCPVREGAHDFFNGLAWRKFPRAKSRLNALHAAHIREHGIAGERGPVRDAATLFDENGALLQAPEAIWEALQQRDWQRMFVDLRASWADAQLTVFGHALLEKLLSPRKALTAHVLAAPCPPGDADRWLENQLAAPRLAAKPFLPLPVMGIPGWDAGNADFSFYDDARVFRPAGRQESGPDGPRTTQPSAPPTA